MIASYYDKFLTPQQAGQAIDAIREFPDLTWNFEKAIRFTDPEIDSLVNFWQILLNRYNSFISDRLRPRDAITEKMIIPGIDIYLTKENGYPTPIINFTSDRPGIELIAEGVFEAWAVPLEEELRSNISIDIAYRGHEEIFKKSGAPPYHLQVHDKCIPEINNGTIAARAYLAERTQKIISAMIDLFGER